MEQVVLLTASQLQGPWFNPVLGSLSVLSFFLCMFFLYLCGFTPGALSFFLPSKKHVRRWIGYALSVPGIGSEST